MPLCTKFGKGFPSHSFLSTINTFLPQPGVRINDILVSFVVKNPATKMKYLFSIIITFFALPLYAQLDTVSAAQGDVLQMYRQLNQDQSGGSPQMMSFDNRSYGLLGSPYLLDDWAKGLVMSSSGKLYKGLNLVYNVSLEILYMQDDNSKNALELNMVNISSFEILDKDTGQPMFFKKIKGEDGIYRYYQVIYEGDISLLVDYNKRLRKADRGVDSYSSNEANDQWVTSSEWFLFDGSQFQSFKRSRGSFLRATGAYKKALKSYMKENGLTVKSNSDLRTIVAYYDSIRKQQED